MARITASTSSLNGEITNTCSKPITRISLHGRVFSDVGFQTNVTMDEVNDILQIVLAPSETTDYSLTIPNRNYYLYDTFNCQVNVQGAYYVK